MHAIARTLRSGKHRFFFFFFSSAKLLDLAARLSCCCCCCFLPARGAPTAISLSLFFLFFPRLSSTTQSVCTRESRQLVLGTPGSTFLSLCSVVV